MRIMNAEDVVSRLPSAIEFRHENVGAAERLASIVAGGAAVAYGLSRGSLTGYGVAAAGGVLLFRGVTGYCPVNAVVGRDSTEVDRRVPRIEIRTSLTVEKRRDEVYAYWRRLENLPRFMKHVSDVRQAGARRSEWSAPIPHTDLHIEWEAEVEADEDGSRLAWRSVEGSDIDNAGEVRFEDAAGDRGTVVHVRITYGPPTGRAGTAGSFVGAAAGKAASAVAKLLNPAFEQMVKEDIRRFKRVIETGELPSTSGQPAGSR